MTATTATSPGRRQHTAPRRRIWTFRRMSRRAVGIGWGVLAWICGLVLFIPVGWMVITAFKPQAQAATFPPRISFHPTLSEFRTVLSNNGIGLGGFFAHSAEATIASTAIVLLLGVPAAYALSIRPVRSWRDALFFFLTTKMLPLAAAIMPLYVIAKDLHLLDHVAVLVLLYTSMNLPVAIWMLRSFMLEIPSELLEAARLDGASLGREIVEVMLPSVAPGIAATALICIIFAWNELFLATNLTATSASTLPVFIAAIPNEGLFYGTLAAEATIASLPVVLIGWIAQRQLVRGLSLGAIK